MNTYDFDKTIFPTDSSFLFIRYCIKNKKGISGTYLLKLSGLLLMLFSRRISTKEFKESAFSFLKNISDVDGLVNEFWEENYGRIEPWYLRQKREDDVIISASPEFLLAPVTDRLGVSLIATPMDKHSGKILGENCHDHEKVKRFYEQYPDGHSDCFYSDSLSDTPMAEISDRAYIVKAGKLSPWPEK